MLPVSAQALYGKALMSEVMVGVSLVTLQQEGERTAPATGA